MNEETLVKITISRKEGEIAYNVECAKDINSAELAHYIDEVIKGICKWKPEVCTEQVFQWNTQRNEKKC